jgi:hypothetical protein
MFYQNHNDLVLKKTADGAGDKLNTVRSLSVSGVNAIAYYFVTYYDIHGRKGEVLFFSSVLDCP